jgi:hypothetical protein
MIHLPVIADAVREYVQVFGSQSARDRKVRTGNKEGGPVAAIVVMDG